MCVGLLKGPCCLLVHSKVDGRETQVLKMLYKGNMEQISRREQQEKNDYCNTRCICMTQEEQSAIPAGVFNADEDSDDEDAYLGEQKELQKEMQELLAAKDWINKKGWDVASEALVVSPSSGKTIDLRLDWAMVEQKLKQGYGDLAVSDAGDMDEVKVLSDFSLDKLDPTQRVFAVDFSLAKSSVCTHLRHSAVHQIQFSKHDALRSRPLVIPAKSNILPSDFRPKRFT